MSNDDLSLSPSNADEKVEETMEVWQSLSKRVGEASDADASTDQIPAHFLSSFFILFYFILTNELSAA